MIRNVECIMMNTLLQTRGCQASRALYFPERAAMLLTMAEVETPST